MIKYIVSVYNENGDDIMLLPDFCYCQSIFEKYSLELTKELYEKLSIYAEFLCEYNKKVNLTAITGSEEILVKHFIDSIVPLVKTSVPVNASFIDVGTGAGFPSVPMKLYRPDIKVTLLDSLNKRILFLEQLCEKLNIECECIHERAEILAKNPDYREKYDVSSARAVAAMPVLCEYCMPFLKKGGIFIAMKGRNDELSEAAAAIRILGGKTEQSIEYNIENECRRIFVIKKISQTPTKYPRNSGQIKSKPL